jgi:hypothetical protein
MSVGFTPGPWNLVTNKFGEHVVAAGDDDIFLLDDTESSVSDHDEYTANARLIAVAPELYEALVRLGTIAAAKYGNSDDELWGAITQGIAATAKARGEA